jgi:hypothetical protein
MSNVGPRRAALADCIDRGGMSAPVAPCLDNTEDSSGLHRSGPSTPRLQNRGPAPGSPDSQCQLIDRWCACTVTRPRRVRLRRLRSGCVRCAATSALTSAQPTSGRGCTSAPPPSRISPCSALARSSAAPGRQGVDGACAPAGSASHDLFFFVAAESTAPAPLDAFLSLFTAGGNPGTIVRRRPATTPMDTFTTSVNTSRCSYAHNCTVWIKFPYYLVTVPRAPLTPPPRT